MVRLYNSHHHSCFLYLASILVDEYGSENDCIGGFISMLEALLPMAFQLLQEPQGFCHNPDTVDDLFRLFARFLQRNPTVFLQSPALPAVFDCALQAAALDHRDANASVMQFLSELIHTTRTREVCCGLVNLNFSGFWHSFFYMFVTQDKLSFELRDHLMSSLLRPKGPVLISTLITASIFSLSTCSLPNVADVLLEFMLVDRQVRSLLPIFPSFFRWKDLFRDGTEYFHLDGADAGESSATITSRMCCCQTWAASRLPSKSRQVRFFLCFIPLKNSE